MSSEHFVIGIDTGGTFSDVGEGEPVALVDSSGWLTISVRLESAAERYGVEAGMVTRIRALP